MRPLLIALLLAASVSRIASAEEPVPAVATTSGGAAISVPPEEPPAPATITSAAHVSWAPRFSRWPVQLTLGWTTPLGQRNQRLALDKSRPGNEEEIEFNLDVSPIRSLAIGADVLVDSTKSLLATQGGMACSDYTLRATGMRCAMFSQDVYYVSNTYLLMLWAKPYATVGPVRLWAGVGAGYANVDYLYTRDPASTSNVWGHGTATTFNASAGAGLDYAYQLSPNGACFIMSAALDAGASRYGESINHLFYLTPTSVWQTSSASSVVNPLRLQLSIGFSFPTSRPPGS